MGFNYRRKVSPPRKVHPVHEAEYSRSFASALLRLGVSHRAGVRLQTIIDAHVLDVLQACRHDRSMAADILGVPRRTVQRMVGQLKERYPRSVKTIPGPPRPKDGTRRVATRCKRSGR